MKYRVVRKMGTVDHYIVEADDYRVVEGDLCFFNEDPEEGDGLVIAYNRHCWLCFEPEEEGTGEEE